MSQLPLFLEESILGSGFSALPVSLPNVPCPPREDIQCSGARVLRGSSAAAMPARQVPQEGLGRCVLVGRKATSQWDVG